MVPLWPLISLLALSLSLGFIPMFGPAGSDIGLHLLNGLAAVGLLYLFIIVTVFNLQYCRLTLIAARSAASSIGMISLPVQLQVQLFAYVAARCLLVGLFFGFCMVYFFPYSGFMGCIALLLASPPGIKEVGDRLIRRLEFEQPVTEVTPEMASQAAAEGAAEAAAAAAARGQQDLELQQQQEPQLQHEAGHGQNQDIGHVTLTVAAVPSTTSPVATASAVLATEHDPLVLQQTALQCQTQEQQSHAQRKEDQYQDQDHQLQQQRQERHVVVMQQ